MNNISIKVENVEYQFSSEVNYEDTAVNFYVSINSLQWKIVAVNQQSNEQ
jgi:hypothetical protein